MATCGGITPPSLRLVVYIDKLSPAAAGCSDEAICPVSACQMAPWPPPAASGNNTGARDNTAGRNISALGIEHPPHSDPPAISTVPSGSKVAVCPQRAVNMLPAAENVPLSGE